ASTEFSDTTSLASSANDTKPNNETQTIREINVIGDYAIPTDVNELEKNAEIILIGSPTKPFLEREHEATYSADGSLEDYFTRTEIKIDKVLKNDSDLKLKKEGLFEIVEPAVGLINSNNELLKFKTGPYNELEIGSVYLILLTKNMNNDYAVTLNVLGKYNIDGTDKKDQNVEAYHHEYESWKDKKINYKQYFKKKYGF